MAIETSGNELPAFQWLGWSFPLFRFRGITYRLNWTLIVTCLFATVDVIHAHRWDLIPSAIVIPIAVVLLYSLGKVTVLRLVHGNADSSILWSLGESMAMHLPIRPAPQFAVAAAGVAVSLLVSLILITLFRHQSQDQLPYLACIFPRAAYLPLEHLSQLDFLLGFGWLSSGALVVWNLVPSSVFDGGRLWRALLWPLLGLRRATVTSIVGGFLVACLLIWTGIRGTDFFMLVFGLCILLAAVYEWRSMKHYGIDIVIGVEPAFISRERSSSTPGMFGRFLQRREERRLARQEAQEQREQEVLDRLLAKVSEQGLPALTPAERQLLGKISKQQKARSEARESHSSY